MQLAGCNRSIAHPITLVRARHGKSFVSPSSRPLVIALSVNARLAPAACIIKLPACRNADRSLLARTSYTTHATSTRTQRLHTRFPLALFIPLPSTLPPVSSSPSAQTRRRTNTRPRFVHPFGPHPPPFNPIPLNANLS